MDHKDREPDAVDLKDGLKAAPCRTRRLTGNLVQDRQLLEVLHRDYGHAAPSDREPHVDAVGGTGTRAALGLGLEPTCEIRIPAAVDEDLVLLGVEHAVHGTDRIDLLEANHVGIEDGDVGGHAIEVGLVARGRSTAKRHAINRVQVGHVPGCDTNLAGTGR